MSERKPKVRERYISGPTAIDNVPPEASDRTRTEAPRRLADAYYRSIWQNMPVSIWEEDFSDVLDLLDELRSEGVTDLRAYLQENPYILAEMIRLVRLIDVNDYTITLFEAQQKVELLNNLSRIFLPATKKTFIEELVTLWQGDRKYENTAVLRTLKGRQIDVLVTIVFEGERCQYTFVIIHDISAMKASERALRFAHEAAQIEIKQRQQAEKTKDLLLKEIQHRVKNTISMIQVLASKTYRSASREEDEAFSARLQALAGAYDLLSDQNWSRALVASVVDRALKPFSQEHEHRFQVSGTDAWLDSQRSVLLAMIIHELATNALKYGALSNGIGKVDLAWRVVETDKGRRVKLEWRETGGPPVTDPTRTGFGTKLIKQALRSEGGRAYFNFGPNGAECFLELEVQ